MTVPVPQAYLIRTPLFMWQMRRDSNVSASLLRHEQLILSA
jgi:hypothetical protein